MFVDDPDSKPRGRMRARADAWDRPPSYSAVELAAEWNMPSGRAVRRYLRGYGITQRTAGRWGKRKVFVTSDIEGEPEIMQMWARARHERQMHHTRTAGVSLPGDKAA